MNAPGTTWRRGLSAALLAGLVWAVFAQTASFSFLDYDDNAIVIENPHVQAGLTPESVVWAFTHPHFGLYMPVTSLAHLLDIQLFGHWPGGHHLSSVFWHMLAALALYGALAALTGSPWRALLVAALFAVHPTRVTSVAWVADRKDLVCGLFFFLGVWAWARYAARRTVPRYALVALFGLLAMLAKPAAVTFPCVLLLLDWWPLERAARRKGDCARIHARGIAGLCVEKLPLLAIAGAASAGAIWAQSSARGISGLDTIGMSYRVGNAALSYGRYLLHTFWPVKLSIHYPHFQGPFPWGQAALAACALAAISIAVFALHRKPWLAVGWCWFLGVFVPMIGIVQFGNASLADRFLYIPQIGLLLMVVWSLPDPVSVRGKRAMACAAAALVACAAALTYHETSFWRNTEIVFTRALENTCENDVANCKIGEIRFAQDRLAEAVAHFEEAYRLVPKDSGNCYNLGTARMAQGRDVEAAVLLERAIQWKPDWTDALINLGCVRVKMGECQAALEPFERALALEPSHVNGHINYGVALLNLARRREAAAQFEEALRIAPGNAAAKANLELARQPGKG